MDIVRKIILNLLKRTINFISDKRNWKKSNDNAKLYWNETFKWICIIHRIIFSIIIINLNLN